MQSGTPPRTLIEALERISDVSDRGYSHVIQEKDPAQLVSYQDLWRRAGRVAAALQARGLTKGARVGLIVPDSASFVDAIWGVMRAGLVPVPIYPPTNLGQIDSYLLNTTHILDKSGATLVVTDARVRPILGKVLEKSKTVREIETLERLLAGVPKNQAPSSVDIRPDDIAFLQFTSGSTGQPKGVMLTHANLVANAQAIGGPAGIKLGRESVGISWLPLFHDMGLIGFVFTPIVFNVQGVAFASPLAFLKRPALWLSMISRERGSITFAPNFAYGLATKRVKDSELEGIDLSSLRVAGCGAEPIQFDTLDGFSRRFAPWGFRREMFLPCYGMAEHSLAITFIGLDEDLRADHVDAAALAQGEALAASDELIASGQGVVRVVDCGRPFPEHELRIVDPQGQPLADRRVGEIVMRGPSVTPGYFEDEEKTRAALKDGWLHSGDLGYLDKGRLFVCGRIKELIIVNGRNFYPQDIEWLAYDVEGVRRGNAIAFGVSDDESGIERVVLAIESDRPEAERDALKDAVAARVLEGLNLRLDEILVLPPSTLPKTSSGKLQRAKARELFSGQALKGGKKAGSWTLVKHLAASRWSYLKSAFVKKDDVS